MRPNPDLLSEYVAGGTQNQAFVMLMRQVLPTYTDDLTRDFGIALYDRMQRDPAVASSLATLKQSVLADGVRVQPAVEPPRVGSNQDPKQQADADMSAKLVDFVERNLRDLEDSGDSILDLAWELLDGTAYGHKLAERVMRYVDFGDDQGKLYIDRVKPKSSQNVGFIVDAYMNVLGLSAVKPDLSGGSWQMQGAILTNEDIEKMPSFVPRDRFVIFRYGGKNGDPRGESLLAPAYNAWYIKTQVLPEYFKYLKQFGTPLLIGKTPLGAVDEVERDENGEIISTVPVTPEQKMLTAMQNFMNATVMAAPGGSEFEWLQSSGEGKAFLEASDYFDRQIAQAIIGTTRATMESQHGSKADASVGQDILGLRVANIRRSLATCLTRDFIRPLIRINFGEDAMRLCPFFTLAKVEQQDRAALIAAFAQARGSGLIDDSQLPGIDAELGLPERDMDALQSAKEEKAMMDKMAAGELGKLKNPAGNLPADKPENAA